VQKFLRRTEAPDGDQKICRALHPFWFSVAPKSGRLLFLQHLHIDMNCVFCHAFGEEQSELEYRTELGIKRFSPREKLLYWIETKTN
jgi:hypothetical protein